MKPPEDFFAGLDKILDGDEPIPDVDKISDKDDEVKEDDKKEKPKEEAKKEEEDEAPIFTKKTKEQKKSKDESIVDLRSARDEYKKKADLFTSVLGDNDPNVIKPLLDLISDRADGPVTTEVVTSIITEIQEKDAEIADLKLKLDEQDKLVTQVDIQHSPTFAKKYKEPYIEAGNALFAEYANVGDDGKIIAPELTKSLHDYFIANIDNIDGIAAKQQLQIFAKKYKAQTGEDAILPSVNSLMSSIRSFKSKRNDMQEAYTNWKKKKEEDETSITAQTERERELTNKKLKRERIALSSKAFQDFDLDEVDFVDQSEIQSLFQSEYQAGEKLFSGAEVPTYDVMLTRGVKAALWDKMLPKIKALMDKERAIKDSERSGLRGSDKFVATSGKSVDDDWTGGII